ncbi:oligosaccharide flippase family protein [Kaistella sp.]|uniref:oligosaccharide flippase family protein n=1 Tax=Kaistella sp. TaxID=2782235 RepID=UPI00359F2D60
MFNRHKKVIENYFFMTVLQVINSLFFILIYPYLIRTLGAESYGLYIYTLSIVTYFIFIVNFGFDLPAAKAVALNKDDKTAISHILSCIFTAKIYLQLASLIIFAILLVTVPFLRSHSLLFIIVFSQTINFTLFPTWYYQGIQKMKTATIIQVILKLISLPLILFLVKSPQDLSSFAVITSGTTVVGGAVAMMMVIFVDKMQLRWAGVSELKKWFREAFPFFLSNSVGTLKEVGIPIIVGVFFGMRDVAIYDLANKIIIIPRTILMSVNSALFPKIVVENNIKTIKKIIKYEFIVGLMVIILIIAFGYGVVLFLGGKTMTDSYPLAIILSVTILSWLVVGAIISFIFIPNNKYYLVTINQIIALVSVGLFILIGFTIKISIFVLVGALAFSGIVEIIYCLYQTKKLKLHEV